MRALSYFALGAVLLVALAAAPIRAEEEAADSKVDGFSETDRQKLTDSGEKHEFNAEVSRLMDIIINSLYTNKEVFLREIVSNSADALEKARFLSVQDPSFLGEFKDLEVKVEYDSDAKTITISDTGVGMTKADLINNLGTLAKSGTTNFLEAMADGADASLIGQFGVGFYSAFLVADKVVVTSKNNEDPVQHVWESTADASFTIAEDPRGNTLGRGSRVTLHLKEDAHEFLGEDKLKDLTKKFSQFMQFPIYIKTTKVVEDDDTEEEEEEKEDGDVESKDDEAKEDGDKKADKQKSVSEWEQVNTQKAIWLRNKEDVKDEEYNEFYKAITKDYLDPLTYTHFNAEGEIEFRSILFIPKKAPFDMMDNYHTKKSEVRLYVRRVLVADRFEDLLPRYLGFIRGVVDSDDLPLHVSREQLQQTKIMKVISKKLVRKALELMKKMAKDDDKSGDDEEEDEEKKEDKEAKEEKEGEEESLFTKFYKEFNKALKMGCYEDDSNRSKLSKLMRYYSSKSPEKLISLDKYLDNMKEGQESIYYASGDSIDLIMKSPSMQVFVKKDLEVLLLDDHLDESCMQKLSDYEGKKFMSVQKADVKFDETEDEQKRFSKLKSMYKPLTDWWKDQLTDLTEKGALKASGIKVEAVAVSKRLVEDPCVVVTSQFGQSAHQERVMRAQSSQNKENLAMMAGRKTLEINANHPIIVDLLSKVKNDPDEEGTKETAALVFQGALLASGYDIVDPSALVKKIYGLMSKELGVDPNAEVTDVDVPEDVDEEETSGGDESSSDDSEAKEEM